MPKAPCVSVNCHGDPDVRGIPTRIFLNTTPIQKKPARYTRTGYRRAANEARTRDPQLGKLMLYQLSYYRICFYGDKCSCFFSTLQIIAVLLPIN